MSDFSPQNTAVQPHRELGAASRGATSAWGKTFWLTTAFSLSAVTAIGFFFLPAFVIRPFRYQAPRALWLAMFLRQRAPTVTLIAGLTCLVCGIALWRRSGRWLRGVFAIILAIVTFSAVMARLNYFEWMFHPVADPRFLAESESKLDPKEMIMAVRLGAEDRAYPIRQMAYHHVLNDVVGGLPIVATY